MVNQQEALSPREAKLSRERFMPLLEMSEDDIPDSVAEVTVTLGCADFAKRDLPNRGGFAVFLSLKTKEGRYLGNAAYCGMVYSLSEFELTALWQATGRELDRGLLFMSAGANRAEYLDEKQQPMCHDCLTIWGTEELENATPQPDLSCACSSCVEMIQESMRQSEEGRISAAHDEYEQARSRSEEL